MSRRYQNDLPNEILSNGFKTYLHDSKKTLREFLQQSVYLQEARIDAPFLLEYMIEEYDTLLGARLAIVVLLTLLPNVIELPLPVWWNATYHRGDHSKLALMSRTSTTSAHHEVAYLNISALLELIPAKANNLRDQSASLSKLTTILPSTAWDCERTSRNINYFTPLLCIRSVRKFSSGNNNYLYDDNLSSFGDFNEAGLGTGLEELELAGVGFEDVRLEQFLSQMSKLRILRYYDVAQENYWNAEDSMAAIIRAVGETLKELSFSGGSDFKFNESGLQCMKGFKNLRRLELDVSQLLKDPHDQHRIRHDGPIFRGSPSSYKIYPPWRTEIPRLGELLPSTIEKLTLLHDGSKGASVAMNCLFAGFPTEPQDLGSLKEITIRRSLAGDHDGEECIMSTDEAEEVESETDEDTYKGSFWEPATYANDQLWEECLRNLGLSVEVKIVPIPYLRARCNMPGNLPKNLPVFVEDFCSRYGVEVEED